MNNQVLTSSKTENVSSALVAKPLQLLGAFLLGAMVIYGAGFLQTSIAHNAAHDMRHSQGFPCH